MAQGLAFGAGKPVLPIDSLLAVAEDARRRAATALRIWAVIDARMDQIYAAEYRFATAAGRRSSRRCCTDCDALARRWRRGRRRGVAGDALSAFGAACDWPRRDAAVARRAADARRAAARWREQPGATAQAVDAALALPLYVRDKVAQTEPPSARRRAPRAAAAARMDAIVEARFAEAAERAIAGMALRPMTVASLDGVLALEDRGLSVPLDARQLRRFARRRLHRVDPERQSTATWSATAWRCRGVGEMHLLNITVAPAVAPARPRAAPARRAGDCTGAPSRRASGSRCARATRARATVRALGFARSASAAATTRRPAGSARTRW